MDVIRFQCPRCGRHLRVPPAKAGHHGRCPTCGGRIKVPLEDAIEHIPEGVPHHHVRAMFGVVIALFLIVAVAFLTLRGGGSGGGNETETTEAQREVLATKLQQVRQRLTQLDDVEERFASYKRMMLSESKLRARDVRRRLNTYEPVNVFECALREKILAMRDEQIKASPNSTAIKDDWQLDKSLTTLEREQLKQLSDQLEARSAELVEALARTRIRINLSPDPLGRRLLNPIETEARIQRERELLQESETDIRRQMANPVAGKG